MPDLPALKPRELVRALERGGFVVHRQRGSHAFLYHPDSRRATVVPMHNRDVDSRLLRAIIKQADLTVEEFLRLHRG